MMHLTKTFIFLLLTTLITPQTAHAYLVPLLGGAGAMASFVIVIAISSFIFGFFTWYNIRKIYRKIKPHKIHKTEVVIDNDQHKNCPSILAKLVFNHRNFWLYLGNKESSLHKRILTKTKITKPIYVTGLARSGTTIVLESLAKSPQVATQKYRNFPFIFTPYLWTKTLILLDNIFTNNKKKERSHKDGLLVNSRSPEAMEEPLWMAYFENIHKVNSSNILTSSTKNKEFEQFYKNHIKKTIAAEKKERYLCKGNYNITRVSYIQKLYPDAKIIIMVRNPINHIFSLIKQHRLFKLEHTKNPQTLTHMNMLGHFEFGNNLIPLNVGQDNIDEIRELFKIGQDVKAMSKYWASIYDYVSKITKDHNDTLLLIRYEDLCSNTEETLNKIYKFCALTDIQSLEELKDSINQPNYYQLDFNKEELQIIESETKTVAELFGY